MPLGELMGQVLGPDAGEHLNARTRRVGRLSQGAASARLLETPWNKVRRERAGAPSWLGFRFLAGGSGRLLNVATVWRLLHTTNCCHNLVSACQVYKLWTRPRYTQTLDPHAGSDTRGQVCASLSRTPPATSLLMVEPHGAVECCPSRAPRLSVRSDDTVHADFIRDERAPRAFCFRAAEGGSRGGPGPTSGAAEGSSARAGCRRGARGAGWSRRRCAA